MEMKNPNTIWAAVMIVFILVAGSVSLTILDKDPSVILTLAGLVAVPVLGAFGVAVYQKLDQVKEASNGNLTKLMDMQRETQQQLTNLALSVQPKPALPSLDKEQDPGGLNEGVRYPG